MKLSIRIAAAIAVATASLSTQAIAGGPPELTATEMTQVQSHRYSVPPDVAFKATLAALQTLGYVDINASKDAGTISAVTEAKAKTIYNFFWGFGKKKWTQKASLLIEDEGTGSRVRLNMLLSETKARGIFGTSFTDGKVVRFAGPYQDFFAVLDAEMANRGAVARAVATPIAIVTASTNANVNAQAIVDLGGGVRLVPAKTASGYCIEAAPGYVGTGSTSRPATSDGRPLCT
ncbi:MAG: hypothetical protein ABI422_04975 [Sphingomicrobium sp.]